MPATCASTSATIVVNVPKNKKKKNTLEGNLVLHVFPRARLGSNHSTGGVILDESAEHLLPALFDVDPGRCSIVWILPHSLELVETIVSFPLRGRAWRKLHIS